MIGTLIGGCIHLPSGGDFSLGGAKEKKMLGGKRDWLNKRSARPEDIQTRNLLKEGRELESSESFTGRFFKSHKKMIFREIETIRKR